MAVAMTKASVGADRATPSRCTLSTGKEFPDRGHNITSQEAVTSVSTEPGLEHNRAEFVGRPRTVGLELNHSFKDH